MNLEEIIELQKQRIEIQTHTISSQLVEIAELHRKNSELLMKIGKLEETITSIMRQSEQVKQVQSNQIERKELELRKQKKKKEEQEEELEKLRILFREQQNTIKYWENQTFQMKNSKSWKITEPLRNILWKMESGKK